MPFKPLRPLLRRPPRRRNLVCRRPPRAPRSADAANAAGRQRSLRLLPPEAPGSSSSPCLTIRQARGFPAAVRRPNTGSCAFRHSAACSIPDPDRVIPLLREIALESKDAGEARRAVFVLAQSGTPEARTTVVEVARSGSEPVRVAAVVSLVASAAPTPGRS